MSPRGKRLSNSFNRPGVITQAHSSVNDTSIYKRIDSSAPKPARARHLTLLCEARAPLPARPTQQLPSEKGAKLSV
ncbi:hypothetical protein V8E53_011661, partial [Lactarius tabidus]